MFKEKGLFCGADIGYAGFTSGANPEECHTELVVDRWPIKPGEKGTVAVMVVDEKGKAKSGVDGHLQMITVSDLREGCLVTFAQGERFSLRPGGVADINLGAYQVSIAGTKEGGIKVQEGIEVYDAQEITNLTGQRFPSIRVCRD